MITWLVIHGLLNAVLVLLGNGTHNRRSSILIQVNERFLRYLVPLSLLNPVELNLISCERLNSDCIFVFVLAEPLISKKNVQMTDGYGVVTLVFACVKADLIVTSQILHNCLFRCIFAIRFEVEECFVDEHLAVFD